MTHAQGDRWDVYREQIRLDAAGKPEALFQGEWEPLLMREEHFQIHEDDGSISEHSEVFWASPRHGVVLRCPSLRRVSMSVAASRSGCLERLINVSSEAWEHS